MLVIRLFRTGKKNQPSFKIVVTDKRESSTTGRSVEEVGFWNPLTKEKALRQERIKYWLSVGAKPSPTVFNLLVSEKIVEGKKIDVHKKAKEKEPVVADSASVATSAKEAAPPGKEEKPKEEPKKEEKPKEVKPKEPAVAEAVAGKEKPKEEVPKEEKKEPEKKEETPKTE